MKEQDIQYKILNYLKAQGFVICKVIVANKAGILDIIACSPTGRYWEVEVKTPVGRASKLQKRRNKAIRKNNGVSFFAYSYEDFLEKFNHASVVKVNGDESSID